MTLNEFETKKKIKGIDISVVTSTKEFKSTYEKNRETLGMEEVVGRPIRLIGWDIGMRENIKKIQVEMATLYYVFTDDETETTHITNTESAPIRDVLKSIPESAIKIRDAEGGFLTKIIGKMNMNKGTTYYLDIGNEPAKSIKKW
jgi:hypothetical protein